MEDIREKINVANVHLEKGNFDRADKWFADVWRNLDAMNADDSEVVYAMKEWDKYNKTKDVMMRGYLVEAWDCAGRGNYGATYDYMEKCALLGKSLRLDGLMDGESSCKVVSELKDIENLVYLVAIPLDLAMAEILHKKKDFVNRDLTLECVRMYGDKIGMDLESSIEDVMDGRNKY